MAAQQATCREFEVEVPPQDKSRRRECIQLVVDNKPQDLFAAHLVAIIPTLRAFARGLCRRAELVDDLVQEALVKAWAAKESFVPGTNFNAWMFTIVRHHYYTLCRKQQYLMPWDPEAAERLLVCEPSQIGHLELAELVCALVALPACQGDALLLVAVDGCSYEEVADILGCAVGTAKSRVARGRIALRNYLQSQAKPCGSRRMTSSQASAVLLDRLSRLGWKSDHRNHRDSQINKQTSGFNLSRHLSTQQQPNSRVPSSSPFLMAVGQGA